MKKSLLIGAGVLTLSIGAVGATYGIKNVNAGYNVESNVEVSEEGEKGEATRIVNNMKSSMLAIGAFICDDKIVSAKGDMYCPLNDDFARGVIINSVNYGKDLFDFKEIEEGFLVGKDDVALIAGNCMTERDLYYDDIDALEYFEKDEESGCYIIPKVQTNYDILVKDIAVKIYEDEEYPYHRSTVYTVVADITRKDGNTMEYKFAIDATEPRGCAADSDLSNFGRIKDVWFDEADIFNKF